jgi:hypothetical protein
MGMFDHIQYKDQEYQTKDTPRQLLDNYKIDELGQVWVEEYDSEWNEDEGLFGGSIRQFNQRWRLCPEFDGNLRFYRSEGTTWVEYQALFMDGIMIKIREVFDEPLTQWYREGVKDKGLE